MKNKLKNSPQLLGYFFAFGATAIWSGNFIIARGLNESIPPISLAFWRWFVAVIILFPFAIKNLIANRIIIRKNILYLTITAILGVTIFNTLIYLAGHTTTAVNLSLISISFPIFIIILSRIFYKEHITRYKAIGIVLVLIGVVLLISKGELSSLLSISFAIGDIWMLLAAIIFAIYTLLLKHKPKNLDLLTFQLSTFIIGLIFLFPFYIWENADTHHIQYEIKTILSILYVGIFASLSAYILWNSAVNKIGATNAGMIYYTIPLFSGFLAFIFLEESIGLLHFYSLVLIISGILTATYTSKEKK
ncbi:MAG: DMT family transporter [Flavobacteriaceae bacterium]|nr:DMT family transporter [Flavobacteriaceae bacterium]